MHKIIQEQKELISLLQKVSGGADIYEVAGDIWDLTETSYRPKKFMKSATIQSKAGRLVWK